MQKYRIFFSADRPSPEEMNAHQDFDKVLQKHRSALVYSKLVKAGISVVTVAGLVGALLFLSPSPPDTVESNQISQASGEAPERQPVPPLAGSQAVELSSPLSANVPKSAEPSPDRQNEDMSREKTVPGLSAPERAPAEALTATSRKESEEGVMSPKVAAAVPEAGPAETTATGKPALGVFTQPEPLLGYKALHEYFAREIKHPQGEAPDRVSGVVLVSFAIDEQGKPEGIEIEKKLNAACDAEAVRLVEQMPPWKPASIDGKVVKTRLAVPVRF
ncbi:hypothetical protein BH24BAC1_BH24BAC1_31510 [soil metagenome]